MKTVSAGQKRHFLWANPDGIKIERDTLNIGLDNFERWEYQILS